MTAPLSLVPSQPFNDDVEGVRAELDIMDRALCSLAIATYGDPDVAPILVELVCVRAKIRSHLDEGIARALKLA